MFKKLWSFNYLYVVLICFAAIQTLVLYLTADTVLFVASLVLLILLTVITLTQIFTVSKKVNKLISSINEDLDNAASNALAVFNLPVLIVSHANEIIWYNSLFSENVDQKSERLIGRDISEIIGEDGVETLVNKDIVTIAFNNRIYDVYETEHTIGGVTQHILCFVDQTELRKTASEYRLSRPVVAFIAVDNLDELTHNMRESERSNITSKIQTVLEDWFSTSNGISRKLSGDRYMFVFEERDLASYVSGKFDILARIRSIDFGDRGRATVSVGIGRGNSMRECEEQAHQALDMALGRGGDQVAIKNLDNTFQFFGGLSGSNEKRSRVRTRIVASALMELVNSSDQVVLMGHKFADLDCFGAAYALCSAIRRRTDTPAVIALNDQTALVKPLINRLKYLNADLMFADYNTILPQISDNTLLIILDTHRSAMLEYGDLLYKVGKVVVIDHHRKAVDHISNAVIFYHEPSASSASEMVSELLQYVNEASVGRAEAEALLAGITLDTRNFCINTGVRTFEASAFLRSRGADPIAIKKLFSDSLQHNKVKNQIIATSEQYKDYAIAVNNADDIPNEEMRILSSGAANEMLNISGIKASFVLSCIDSETNISARSYGDVNVQLIMESLGGGGHRTMAACQIKTTDLNEAKAMLISAINKLEEDN